MVFATLVWACLPDSSLQAQSTVANGIFSTQDLLHWVNTDPSVAVAPGSGTLGLEGYCIRKNPGSPNDNGSITQAVHLVGGVVYNFSACIASLYTCSS